MKPEPFLCDGLSLGKRHSQTKLVAREEVGEGWRGSGLGTSHLRGASQESQLPPSQGSLLSHLTSATLSASLVPHTTGPPGISDAPTWASLSSLQVTQRKITSLRSSSHAVPLPWGPGLPSRMPLGCHFLP